ncbi:MAG: 2Fe-2S iron-sulfur cluster binding domain-containing protein [Flavobacteriales bacterium]|nr:2Fe-2S iron-sulfur cluster binding domain-containing protein [Flavobacteriales bacterium]
MATFHPLEVVDIKRETVEAVSIKLRIPADLAEEFKFIPGQYVMFKHVVNGEELKRSYSISSSPQEGELRVGVKEVPGGRFSTYANQELKVGDTLNTLAPRGRFVIHTDPSNKKHYVSFCAGSGVTPIISMMKHVLETEPQSHFTCFYGNRYASTIIYVDEINALKNRFPDRLEIHYVMSKEEMGSDFFRGRIDEEKIRKFSEVLFDPAEVDAFYMCGPEQIIHAAKKVLEEKGVAEEKLHFELFGSPNPTAGFSSTPVSEETKESVRSHITVVMDGDEFAFEMNPGHETILDAADRTGLDVPYSCKGGVCCTCLARIKEGEVTMTRNYSLTDKEVASGLVLTCQAHPKTDRVVVDFDDIW